MNSISRSKYKFVLKLKGENMLNEPKIVFEDENFVVLDKPYGLTVNRSETTKGQETLQDFLEKKFSIFPDPLVGIPTPQGGWDNFPACNCLRQKPMAGRQFSIDQESDFCKRSGIVHRLDKDTSGLILIAKNPETFIELQRQFKERIVKKTYLALVWGTLNQDGEVNAPITRNPYNRKRFGVFIGGKEAHTLYHVVNNQKIKDHDITLLEVSPETGRTHQIRVHLNYIGHPIVGDPLYSGRKLGKEGLRLFGRLMLHAAKISFINPKDKKRQEYKSEKPEEFTKIAELSNC